MARDGEAVAGIEGSGRCIGAATEGRLGREVASTLAGVGGVEVGGVLGAETGGGLLLVRLRLSSIGSCSGSEEAEETEGLRSRGLSGLLEF